MTQRRYDTFPLKYNRGKSTIPPAQFDRSFFAIFLCHPYGLLFTHALRLPSVASLTGLVNQQIANSPIQQFFYLQLFDNIYHSLLIVLCSLLTLQGLFRKKSKSVPAT